MSSDEQDEQDAVDAIFDQIDRDGIVVRSVSDGKVFLFKRKKLEAMLKENPSTDLFTIFVKNAEQN